MASQKCFYMEITGMISQNDCPVWHRHFINCWSSRAINLWARRPPIVLPPSVWTTLPCTGSTLWRILIQTKCSTSQDMFGIGYFLLIRWWVVSNRLCGGGYKYLKERYWGINNPSGRMRVGWCYQVTNYSKDSTAKRIKLSSIALQRNPPWSWWVIRYIYF